MIQVQSNPALVLQLAYAAFAAVADDAAGTATEFLDSFLATSRPVPPDGVRDGWFKMPDSAPPVALRAVPVRIGAGDSLPLGMRITVYPRFKQIHRTANENANLVNDYSYVGDVVFQGTLATQTSGAVVDKDAAGSATNFSPGSGLWTPTHVSTSNVILLTTALAKFPSFASVPVNAGDIVRVQQWTVGDDSSLINTLLGFY